MVQFVNDNEFLVFAQIAPSIFLWRWNPKQKKTMPTKLQEQILNSVASPKGSKQEFAVNSKDEG